VYPSNITLGEYEIYCVKRKLFEGFEGVERYETLEEAEKRIKNLLGGEIVYL
jgi:hypothetical protein